MSEKIAVAMSGGVDSTVCALLLQKKYDVHGYFMNLGLPDHGEQIKRVRHIAGLIDVPLVEVDLADDFAKEVVDYFCRSYAEGRTPNPCVICNPRIKFGKLFNAIHRDGIEKMATGHYVRLSSDGRRLLQGIDAGKDQSYFLCGLSRIQLQHVLFPLGVLTKREVYSLAADAGLHFMEERESQDVCFLQNESPGDFLKKKADCQKGDIVTRDGKIIGRHSGVFYYTVGQRRGVGVCDRTPYYVTGLCAEKNQVIVGKKADLLEKELLVRSVNWISGEPPHLPGRFMVKIRYRHQPAPAQLSMEGRLVRVVFCEAQRAITPGQFAVFYDGDEVVGGGEIVKKA